MKGIKVIDVGSNPYMVLEFPDGTQATLETYYWVRGDCFESTVDNVVDFSTWLSEKDLFDEDFEALKSGNGKHVLFCLIDEYNWELEETDE